MFVQKNRILPIVLVVSFLSLSTALLAKENPSGTKTSYPKSTLYKDLDVFSKVLTLIENDYVEDTDDRDLVYGAVRGMLSTLDPHSVFMSPEVYRELKVDTAGRFGGVGLEVTIKDNFLTVVTAIEGSPAAKAGIHSGDKIIKIDNQSARELGLAESVRLMRGPRGSRVHLTIAREGTKESLDFNLHRDIIHIQSVRWEIPEEGYGYIRISSFQEDTAEDLTKAITDVEKKSEVPVKGIVLDLRNNPGGLLDEAVDVADLFLDSGTIVSTASRNHEIDRREATKNGHEPNYPIVILVNSGSASAAEIVAGALQDQKRATLIGTRTFGKGSVQTIFELDDGAALKLTVAKYYTPSGRSIDGKGINPDVVVEGKKSQPSATLEEESESDDRQKEAALFYLKTGKKSK